MSIRQSGDGGGPKKHNESSSRKQVKNHKSQRQNRKKPFTYKKPALNGHSRVFGAEANEMLSVSVMEGDSVTLNTDLTEFNDGRIVLKFGAEKSLIAMMKRNKQNSTFDVLDGRFRDRLKLDRQTGSLTITNIRTQHAGLYEVDISGAKKSSKTFNVSVYAQVSVPVISSNSSQCSSSSSSSQQNCSLLCSVVNVGHVTLSWYKGNSLLSSISVSDLSISLSLPLEVEYQEKNSYSCVINNHIRNQTTHLDITQLCHTCSDQSLPMLYIVLISAVVGSLLIVAAVLIFCICRKCRKSDQEGKVQSFEEEITYVDPTFHKRKPQSSLIRFL
ncbi:T-cell surface antigen CD2-like [Carassius auratus]|uniref:T-cell surface antigen CD2-like n=1 Tax=Carassius auratus TaxID=7957 RepID=A0A6P6NIU6_CARAU|nr:T-cell surface antigen CD2-like [Carassius auratus]